MYAKLILIPILLIGACAGQDKDVKSLISSIFDENAPLPNTVAGATTTNHKSQVVQYESSYTPCIDGKVCVLQYLCPEGAVIKDGKFLIDIRSFDGDGDGECNFLEKCCAIDDVVNKLPNTSPDQFVSDGCGFRNKNGVILKVQKITDNEAEFGEFPWMIAVMQSSTTLPKDGRPYIGGGSLISPTVVLTAAHKVYDKKAQHLLAKAGEWEANSKSEPLPHQQIQVQDIIVHEDFNQNNLFNDIALLILEAPFKLDKHINTICLPPAGTNFDTSRCFVSGWGKHKFQNGRYANILKKIDLPVVPHYKCQSDLRKTRVSKFFNLHSSFMCAGGERDKDTCSGDGGSALVCPMANDPDRYFQAGIVAWGIGCGDENVPGVYASLPQLRSWIDDQLTHKNIDTSFFKPIDNEI